MADAAMPRRRRADARARRRRPAVARARRRRAAGRAARAAAAAGQQARPARLARSRPRATPGAEPLREHAASLSGAARLPWFERLLARMAAQPLAARQELLQATRRVMGARGIARPIDRLHWLAMRRGLGEVAPLAARPEAQRRGRRWLESDVLCVAAYTAFLSRMVPGRGRRRAAGPRLVRQRHGDLAAVRRDPARASRRTPRRWSRRCAKLQTLSWMQRPVIVRNWVTAAIKPQPRRAPRRPRRRRAAADLRPARLAAAARAGAALHRRCPADAAQ